MAIEIIDKKMCSGCTACMNSCPVNCISMKKDNEGFWYPKTDESKCINCHKCKNVCPIEKKYSTSFDIKAYAAYNRDDAVRLQSSSGGMFTLFAQKILSGGGAVCGAAFNLDFSVSHKIIEDPIDLPLLRVSKYTQSDCSEVFAPLKKILEENRQVLFTGTPCQIAGFSAFLGKDYENLILAQVGCHGVPSPKVWAKYLEEKEFTKNSKLQNVIFRDKITGWKEYSVTLHFNNSEKDSCKYYENIYMLSFLRDFALRPSCFNCSFKGKNTPADITMADFWGISSVKPKMDDDKGTSLLLIHSEKGQQLLSLVLNDSITEEVPFDAAVEHNPALMTSATEPKKRNDFFSLIDNMSIMQAYQKCAKQSLASRVIRKLRNIILSVIKK